MNVSVESYGHAVILTLKGELSADALGVFQQAVNHHLKGGEVIDVLLNLEQVPFIDSAGLEYLLDLQDRLAEKLGQVKLIKPGEDVGTILEITRLRPAFEIFEHAAEAVRALKTGAPEI